MKKSIAVLFMVVLLAGCSGNEHYENVKSESDAELVIQTIQIIVDDVVTNRLSVGDKVDLVVKGKETGEVKVSGSVEYTQNECGQDCVSNDYIADLVFEFKGFSNDRFYKLDSGEIEYYEHTTSKQQGIIYSSDKSIHLNTEKALAVKFQTYSVEDQYYGIEDKVEFSANGSSVSNLKGSLKSRSGDFFNFQ